jgi:hypothetical protein
VIDISKIKKEITRYTILAAVIAEAVSLLVFGPNIFFPYGLAIGVCAAIINLHVISATIERAIERGRKSPVTAGLILRILLYGGAFILAIRTSGLSGAGAAVGFFIPRVVLYIRYGLAPWIQKRIRKEPSAVYRTDTRGNMFIKQPSLTRYHSGKMYVTHRHYKKVRIVR